MLWYEIILDWGLNKSMCLKDLAQCLPIENVQWFPAAKILTPLYKSHRFHLQLTNKETEAQGNYMVCLG
jgi:hypothetical protein